MLDREFKQLLARLPELTVLERKALKDRLAFLDGTKGSSAVVPTTLSQDWILEGAVAALSRRGLTYMPLTVARVNTLAPNYLIESASLRKRLVGSIWTDSKPPYAQLVSFGLMGAQALTEFLQPVMTVGLKALLINVSKLPEALDNSYPGYLEAGMLGGIIGGKFNGEK